MSNAAAPQFEDYWRKKIAEEILDYDAETHQCFGHGCPRCDISSVLRTVARYIGPRT